MHPYVNDDAEQQPYRASGYGPQFDPLVSHRRAQGMERLAYVAGWWWGLASGVIVGSCTTGTLVWLGPLAWQALKCPAC